eukprot:scaffold96312_cov30-Tisochrysis_lutea.AAC.2
MEKLIQLLPPFAGADSPFTHLVPNLAGIDPDDAFSSVPYEKGFSLLTYLTEIVGGHDEFEKFAKVSHCMNCYCALPLFSTPLGIGPKPLQDLAFGPRTLTLSYTPHIVKCDPR